ncbi:MAG: hypothetical protein V4683_16665 [Bacteroidota bacterium]
MKTFSKYINHSSFTVFILLLFWSSSQSIGQQKIDWNHFKTLFNNKEFKRAYDEAIALRKQPYGKNFQVDYILTKCICETGNTTKAKKCFELLNSYPLNKKMKDFLVTEQKNCLESDEIADIEINDLIALITNIKDNNPKAVSRGKMGYVLDCKGEGNNRNAGDYSLKINTKEEELTQRVFQLEEKEAASKYYREMLGYIYDVKITGRFILITKEEHQKTDANLDKAAINLEKAYKFYTEEFGLNPPDKLIAVYLMGDKPSLKEVALKVHGLVLPDANIGYSSIGDLSILGTSSSQAIGTMYHELFHLFVRADIGDIPAWLDEGIASLYETSTWVGNKLKGDVINWRKVVISEFLKTAPNRSLQYVIDKNWKAFTLNESNDLCDISINYAYAKHFAIFMQEKNMLKTVLNQFKERENVFVDSVFNNTTDIELLEKAYHKNIYAIQDDFESWFKVTYNLELNRKNALNELRYVYSSIRYMINPTRLSPEEKITKANLEKECQKLIADLEAAQTTNPANANAVINSTISEKGPDLNELKYKAETLLNTCQKFIAEKAKDF